MLDMLLFVQDCICRNKLVHKSPLLTPCHLNPEPLLRHHPEMLDSLCFPCDLQLPGAAAGATTAAAPTMAAAAALPAPDGSGSTSSSSSDSTTTRAPCSALDSLWQLMRAAPQLINSQPRLLAGVLRLLGVLWECQVSAHGAVERLRSQPGFWAALQACCPAPGGPLPALESVGHPEDNAWRLQVHACALHILLLDTLAAQVEPPFVLVDPAITCNSCWSLQTHTHAHTHSQALMLHCMFASVSVAHVPFLCQIARSYSVLLLLLLLLLPLHRPAGSTRRSCHCKQRRRE